MTQITYLLVQQQTFKVYEICNVHTTRDIPDSCKVGALMDYAAAVVCDLMCLDSDKEVNVRVYMLLRPIDKFHGRSPYDIGNELGSIDQRFMASKVALLSLDQDISRLDPDVLTGRLIIVFSVRWARRPPVDAVKLVDTWTTNRHRDVLPTVHELRDILVTPLVSSEKIPISEKMFMELVSDSSHDRCSPNDLSSLFRIGEPQLSFAMVYAAIVVPAYARGTEANLVSFWDGNIRGLLKLMIPRGRSFRDTHCRPDFRFVVDGSCVFQGSEEGEPRNPENPGKTSSNNFIWPHGSAAPYVLGYYCRGSEMTFAALTAPLTRTRSGRPQVHDIIKVNLGLRKDRIANVRYMINLLPILLAMASLSR